MASELRVNTLKDASGNNSIATSFVANGSLKAWVGAETDASQQQSLNFSSSSDNGTGDYTFALSSSISSANYSHPIVPADADGGGGLDISVTSKASGSIRVGTIRDDSTKTDNANVSVSIFGELA